MKLQVCLQCLYHVWQWLADGGSHNIPTTAGIKIELFSSEFGQNTLSDQGPCQRVKRKRTNSTDWLDSSPGALTTIGLGRIVAATNHMHFIEWKIWWFDSYFIDVCYRWAHTSTLPQVNAWCQTDEKPSPKPMMIWRHKASRGHKSSQQQMSHAPVQQTIDQFHNPTMHQSHIP